MHKTRKLIGAVAIAVALDGFVAFAGLERGMLILNVDDSNVQHALPPEKMTEAGMVEYFDQVNVGRNTHFFICMNAASAAYDSKVWQRCYETDDPRLSYPTNWSYHGEGAKSMSARADKCRLLMERGVDRVKIWSKRAREKGISPWLSMRMNDCHSPDSGLPWLVTSFRLDHPEYMRYPNARKDGKEEWEHYALDYSHKAVRDRALLLVDEMIGRWCADTDGIELDWMRFGRHLAPEVENRGDGAKYLTAFMREVRRIADRYGRTCGKRYKVAVRVTTHPEAARRLGTDAVAWAKEGLVDWVISSCFFLTNDYDLKAAEWKALLAKANPKAKFIVGFDKSGVMTDRMDFKLREATRAELAGYFERMYAEGVKDFYGFNFFQYNPGSPSQKFVQGDGIPDEDALRAEARAYPITWRDTVPDNWRDENHMQIPTNLKTRVSLRVKIGKVGKPSACRARLATNKKVPLAAFKNATLNGVKALSVAETDQNAWLQASYTYPKNLDNYNVYQATEFTFPVSAPKDGYNVFSVGPVEGDVLARSFELFLDAEAAK